MIHYRQCQLSKGETVHTAWIPERYAIVGHYVKIKNKDGTWDDGWHVDTSGARAPEDHVLEKAHDHNCFPSIDPR